MLKIIAAISLLIVNSFFYNSKVIDRSLGQDLSASVLIRMKFKITNNHGESRNALGGCSGTYISQKEILTASHCVEENKNRKLLHVWVRGTDGKSFTAKVIKTDKSHDLALLYVDNRHFHGITKLADSNPKLGEEIWAIGSPLGLEFLISKGVVSQVGVPVKPFKSHYIIHTAMINPGSSGGGLFNTRGELVGVNTMVIGVFGWMGISLSVSVDDVKTFLKK